MDILNHIKISEPIIEGNQITYSFFLKKWHPKTWFIFLRCILELFFINADRFFKEQIQPKSERFFKHAYKRLKVFYATLRVGKVGQNDKHNIQNP